MSFLGLDRDQFPGLDVCQAWKDGGASFVDYYLEAPSHSGSDWMDNRSDLISIGLNVLPIYVGQQITGPGSHRASTLQGGLDGQDAVRKLTEDGHPAGIFCALDIESGPPFVDPMKAYAIAWALTVQQNGYGAMLYVSHAMAAVAAAAVPGVRIYAFQVPTISQTDAELPLVTPDMDSFSYPNAAAVQFRQNVMLRAGSWTGLVDLNASLTPDPAAP